jgi:hypothetical protein
MKYAARAEYLDVPSCRHSSMVRYNPSLDEHLNVAGNRTIVHRNQAANLRLLLSLE